MTYPPQQPGRWGQQQSPFPPPPQAPPPVPPPQMPPWLTNGPGGFPSFEPDPKKPRTGLVVSLVLAGVLVLGGVGAWLLLSGSDDPGGGDGGSDGDSAARTVAEDYVATLERTVNTPVEDIDLSAMESLTCADDFDRMDREIGDAQSSAREGGSPARPPGEIEVGMADFRSTEDGASFRLTQTVAGEEGPDTEMTVVKEGDGWTVCGLYGAPAAPTELAGDQTVPNPIPSG